MNNNITNADIQKIKQLEMTKKLGSFAIRTIIIALCCVAAFHMGKKYQALHEANTKKKQEKETMNNNYDLWKKKYIYLLKTTYCPNLEDNYYCRYAIYDINKDGIPELFFELGQNSDDVVLDIYTEKYESLNNNENLQNFKGFKGPITCITQSINYEKILISCSDGNIYLFSEPELELLEKLNNINII